jgi:hypothetical protein
MVKQGQPATQVAGIANLQRLTLSDCSGLAAQKELSRLTNLQVCLASSAAMHEAEQHLDGLTNTGAACVTEFVTAEV